MNDPVATSTVQRFVVARSLLEEIVRHVSAAAPEEGCGLVGTRDDAAGTRHARRFFPGENVDHSPSRYTMDPAQVLRAIEAMESAGETLGAIAHSHPRTAPEPSETDLAEAYSRDTLLVIVSLMNETPNVRVWRLDGERDRFQAAEVELLVLD